MISNHETWPAFRYVRHAVSFYSPVFSVQKIKYWSDKSVENWVKSKNVNFLAAEAERKFMIFSSQVEWIQSTKYVIESSALVAVETFRKVELG